ncbi:peptidase, M56 domain protein [Peptostreptococcaceae bacterium AS15]|nr:peptidase, M56 domain protein [Peptostreptococcaceae bacterium AS15]
MDLFNLKRKVQVFINDNISTPITYGVIHPKIILQSHIFEDEELLKFVLIHEMTHIKKFDIVFNHIKNLITCLHWFNIFVLIASRYIEDDIEVLCDKLVIQKVGDTMQNRKQYCLSMLKLIEQKEKKREIVLKMHPTKERMVIMKKWKKSFSGVCVLVMVMALSMTVFADVIIAEKDRVTVSDVIEDEVDEEVISQDRIYEKDKVKEISDEEYDKLTLGDIQLNGVRAANIDDKATLSGLEHKSYAFNMSSNTKKDHDSFTIKMSEMRCGDGLNYAIIIKEDGKSVYNASLNRATTLTVKANRNSSYEVIIDNNSTESLKFRVSINSYKR